MQSPKSITRPNKYLLKFEWADGYSATIKVETFRKECPCANCKGETIAGKVVAFPKMQMFTPGLNELKSLQLVGNYAVTATWGDGHDTGIYDWDYLRQICETYALSDEQIEEINRNLDKNSKSSLN